MRDGSALPVVSTGSTHIGLLHLDKVLVSPQIIKSHVSVRQFTTDNHCSVEFDPFGFSVKDLRTRSVITRCNSSDPLYPLLPSASTTPSGALLASTSSQLWHRCLGHLGHEALSNLASSSAIPCNNTQPDDLCHACQLGRHVRLPFSTSQTHALHNFALIHCNLWTYPIPSVSGFKYYLAVLDDHSHYLWTFPLRLKSDTFSTLAHFFSFVATKFGTTIKVCNAIMVVNLTTPPPAFSSSRMVLNFACHAPTPPNRMGKLSMSCARSTTSFVLFFFNPIFPLPIGWKDLKPPPIFSTATPPKSCSF
jgi:hypothetical protein